MQHLLPFLFGLVLAVGLGAQSGTLPERPTGQGGDDVAKDDSKPRDDFTPFDDDPLPDDQDIIILKNGSRFSGRFRAVEGTKVVMRDSEVGDIRIDPDDIYRFWLGKDLDIYYQEAQADDVRQGQLQRGNYNYTSDGLLIRMLAEDAERPRRYGLNDIHKISLTSYDAKPPEWDLNGDLSAFFQIDEGNTKRLTYGSDMRFELKHPDHIFNLRLTGTFATTESKRSTQRGSTEFNYRFLFSERNAIFFRQNFLHDDFARLRVRSVSAFGLTYYLLKEDKIWLSADVGASYTEEHNKQDVPNRYFDAAQFQLKSEWKPNDDLRLNVQTRADFSFDRPSDYIWQNDISLSVAVWEGITTSINIEYDRNSDPPANVEKDDYRVRILLGWRFS